MKKDTELWFGTFLLICLGITCIDMYFYLRYILNGIECIEGPCLSLIVPLLIPVGIFQMGLYYYLGYFYGDENQ